MPSLTACVIFDKARKEVTIFPTTKDIFTHHNGIIVPESEKESVIHRNGKVPETTSDQWGLCSRSANPNDRGNDQRECYDERWVH